jgi:hypothetical protein
MIHKFLMFSWVLLFVLVATVTVSNLFNSAEALLDAPTIDSLRSNIAEALMAIGSGNATQAQPVLIQANQTISQHVCNAPICNIPGGFLSTDDANILRTPIREALMAIGSGNATQAQPVLIQANQTLNNLMG